MDDSDLNRPITQDELDNFCGLDCYACGEPITIPPGGEWVEMRPNTGYAWCTTCLQGGRMNEQDLMKVVGRMRYDTEYEAWIIDLENWMPPADIKDDTWVEVTIRRYDFQP